MILIVDEKLKPHIVQLLGNHNRTSESRMIMLSDKLILMNFLRHLRIKKFNKYYKLHENNNFNTAGINILIYILMLVFSYFSIDKGRFYNLINRIYNYQKAKKIDDVAKSTNESLECLIIDYDLRIDLIKSKINFYYDIRASHPYKLIDEFINKEIDLLEWTLEHDSGSIESLLKISKINFCDHRVKKIFVQSIEIKMTFLAREICDMDIEIVPYSHDLKLSPVAKVMSNPPKFLYVGRISRLKGVDKLIDVFNRIDYSDGVLTLIGGNKMPFKIDNSSISYLGGVKHNLIGSFYYNNDILIHPSYAEGFSYVIHEALSCGLPVIVSRNNAFAELVIKFNAGIVIDIINFESLSSAIKDIVSDRSKYEYMSKNALLVANMFSVKIYIDNLMRLLS